MTGNRPRDVRRGIIAVGVLLVLFIGGAVVWSSRPASEPALVDWPAATPASEGFDADELRALADTLAEWGTETLLIARHGKVVFEWYAPDFDVNTRHYTAAMLKAMAASPTLIAAVAEGLFSLDDHAADWLPSWKSDPRRAQITLHELAFHASGMEDVDFEAGQAGELPGWKQRYYDHPDERFRLAVDSAKILFAPGDHFSYSGVGFYVLSYIVTEALQGRSVGQDIPAFLGEEVYGPLGLPRQVWRIGYARSDTIDGLPLTHFGSGGELTARAAARIGQLFLQRGCWHGTQLLDGDLVDTMLGRHGVTPLAASEDARTGPASGGGWWVNVDGAWPSGPRDAVAAIGASHQVVWIDPTLELVAVRMGGSMATGEESFHEALDRHFVAPLYATLEIRGSSQPNDDAVAGAPRNGDPTGTSCER
jgi:CubicO group peptidase (beta-lactamase class C family)